MEERLEAVFSGAFIQFCFGVDGVLMGTMD